MNEYNIFPSEALIPKPHLGGRSERLVILLMAHIGGALPHDFDMGILRSLVRTILRLSIIHDDITGFAFRNKAGFIPWLRIAELYCRKTKSSHASTMTRVLAEIKIALSDRDLDWNELTPIFLHPENGGRGNNYVLREQIRVSAFEVFEYIALDYHVGMIRSFSAFEWPTQVPKKMTRYLTGTRRSIEAISNSNMSRLADVLGAQKNQLQSFEEMRILVWDSLQTLKRSAGDQSVPLAETTLLTYLSSYFKLMYDQEGVLPPLEGDYDDTFDSNWRETSKGPSKNVLFEDDDIHENKLAPDGYKKEQARKVIDDISRDIFEDETLDILVSNVGSYQDKSQYYYSEEAAVMNEFSDGLSWRALSLTQVRFFLDRLMLDMKKNRTLLPSGNLLISIILTGQSPDFLKSIVIGEWPEPEENIEQPVYVLDKHLILFTPEFIELPSEPLNTKDFFVEVEKFWVIPLPAQLQKAWNQLCKRRAIGAKLFDDEILLGAKAYLKEINLAYKASFPNDAPITISRLRRTFFTSVTKLGNLDYLSASIVSMQWREVVRAPMFYSTISLPFLAKRYQLAVDMMWEKWGLDDNVDGGSMIKVNLPDCNFGSPYLPQREILVEISNKLRKEFRKALKGGNETEIHDLVTLTACCCLGLEGLRISAAGMLTVGQVDLVNKVDGKLLPILILSSTKGNRFKTAGRILPIASKLVPVLESLIGEKNIHDYALYFHHSLYDDEIVPCSAGNIIRRFQKFNIPYIRWHAGRHYLHNWLDQYYFSFDSINAVMGHQSQGRELHNRYLNSQTISVWFEFIDLVDLMLKDLGFGELLDDITNLLPL